MVRGVMWSGKAERFTRGKGWRVGGVRRGFSAVVAGLFLFTQTAGAGADERWFWAERGRAVQSRGSTDLLAFLSPHPLTSTGEAAVAVFPPIQNVEAPVLPGATLRTVHRAARPDAPLILHVQDLHDVEEVQKNISSFIKAAAGGRPGVSTGVVARLVGVEGATGDFPLDPIRRALPADLLTSAADFLLSKNLIGGAEHGGLTSGARLFGAEDPALYHENLRVARQALGSRAALSRSLAPAARALAAARRAHYPEALQKLETLARDCAAGRVSLGDYAAALLARPGTVPAPHTRRFLEILGREKALDFSRVERERGALLEALSARLSPGEGRELLALTVGPRAGPGEFFAGLERLAARHGVLLSRFPALRAYRVYAEGAAALRRDAVLSELQDLERSAEDALARTPAARRLLAADRRWRRLEKLAALGLSPAEWRDYEGTRAVDLPGTLAALGFPAASFPSPAEWAPFEDFFRLALRRNDALAQNLLARMRAGGDRAAILVAGGFHTEGLEAALAGAGATVAVYTPGVTALPRGTPGLAALVRDPLPLERLLGGEPISLVSERPLAPTVNQNPGPQRAVHALLTAVLAVPLMRGGITRGEFDRRWALLRSALPTVRAMTLRLRNYGARLGLTRNDGTTQSFHLRPDGDNPGVHIPLGPASLTVSPASAGVLSALPGVGDVSFSLEAFGDHLSGVTALAMGPSTYGLLFLLVGAVLVYPLLLSRVGARKGDPWDTQAQGRERLWNEMLYTRHLELLWVFRCDGDILSKINAAVGKGLMGLLPGEKLSSDVVFSHRSLFFEFKQTLLELTKAERGWLNRGEGGDEFEIVLQGNREEVETRINRIRAGLNAHFYRRYAFFSISGSLSDGQRKSLKNLPGAVAMQEYAEGFTLCVERWTDGSVRGVDDIKKVLAESGSSSGGNEVSPIDLEAEGIGPLTVSMGGVSVSEAVQALATARSEPLVNWVGEPDGRLKRNNAGLVFDLVFQLANDGLLKAKEAGRNRVHLMTDGEMGNSLRHRTGMLTAGRRGRSFLSWLVKKMSPRAGRDELTHRPTLPRFLESLPRLRWKVLFLSTVVAYLPGPAPVQARAFHTYQEKSGHPAGNQAILAHDNILWGFLKTAMKGAFKIVMSRQRPDDMFAAVTADLPLDRAPTGLASGLRRLVQGSDPTVILYELPREVFDRSGEGALSREQAYKRHRPDWLLSMANEVVKHRLEKILEELPKAEQARLTLADLLKQAKIDQFADVFVEGREALIRLAVDKLPALDEAYRQTGIEKSQKARGLAKEAAEKKKPDPSENGAASPRGPPLPAWMAAFPAFQALSWENPGPALEIQSQRGRAQAAAAVQAVGLGWVQEVASARGHRESSDVAASARGHRESSDVAASARGRRGLSDVAASARGHRESSDEVASARGHRESSDEVASARGRRGLSDAAAARNEEASSDGNDPVRKLALTWLSGPSDRAAMESGLHRLVRTVASPEAAVERLNDLLRAAARVDEGSRFLDEAFQEGRDIVIDLAETPERRGPLVAGLKKAWKAHPGFTGRILFIDREGSRRPSNEETAGLPSGAWAYLSMDELTTRGIMREGRVQVRPLSALFQPSTRLDVYTPNPEAWDMAGVEERARLLVLLTGGLVYNATQRLGETLKAIVFVRLNA